MKAVPILRPNRAEHLAWCKSRALVYIDAGNIQEAFASMTRDLQEHPETRNHVGIELGMMLLMSVPTLDEMRRFIEGFN